MKMKQLNGCYILLRELSVLSRREILTASILLRSQIIIITIIIIIILIVIIIINSHQHCENPTINTGSHRWICWVRELSYLGFEPRSRLCILYQPASNSPSTRNIESLLHYYAINPFIEKAHIFQFIITQKVTVLDISLWHISYDLLSRDGEAGPNDWE